MTVQLLVHGPPGAGKTSISKKLCEHFHLEHISTGDILRENMTLRTRLGRMAKEYINKKALVPDDVVVDMVVERIEECNERGKGWILDGFPRTPEQSFALRRAKVAPQLALVLELPEREIIKRIAGRRFDSITNQIYNTTNMMPKDAVVAARLTRRSDDVAERVPSRLEAYKRHGTEISELHKSISHKVDVYRPLEEVVQEMKEFLLSMYPELLATPSSNQAKKPKTKAALRNRKMEKKFEKVEEEQEEEEEGPEEREQQSKKKPLTTAKDTKISSNTAKEEENGRGASRLEEELKQKLSFSDRPSSRQAIKEEREDEEEEEEIVEEDEEKEDDKDEMEEEEEEEDGNNATGEATAIVAEEEEVEIVDEELSKFKELLVDGFEAVKHGRRGAPHTRLIYCDLELKRVFWQKPNGKANKPKKPKMDQSIAIADLLQVVRGMKTDVLKRSGDVTKYEKYLSLIADDRTLDLELATEQQCTLLLRGFGQLLNA